MVGKVGLAGHLSKRVDSEEKKQERDLITVDDVKRMPEGAVVLYIYNGSYYCNLPRTLQHFEEWYAYCFLSSYVGSVLEQWRRRWKYIKKWEGS